MKYEHIKTQMLVTWPSILLAIVAMCAHLSFSALVAESLTAGFAIVFFLVLLIPLSNRAILKANPSFVDGASNNIELKRTNEDYGDFLFALSFALYLNVCQIVFSFNGIRALLSLPFFLYGSLVLIGMSSEERFEGTVFASAVFRHFVSVLKVFMGIVLLFSFHLGAWRWPYYSFW